MGRYEESRNIKPAVYKLSWEGAVYYRLGIHAHDARRRLAREKKVPEDKIQILDEGKKQ
jgi:hypothetical protein